MFLFPVKNLRLLLGFLDVFGFDGVLNLFLACIILHNFLELPFFLIVCSRSQIHKIIPGVVDNNNHRGFF